MDLPEWVPVFRDTFEKYSPDRAKRSSRETVREMGKQWEATARAHDEALAVLSRDEQIMLAAELQAVVFESIFAFVPLYRLRDRLAGAARKACHARIHGWPSADPHPSDVISWATTGRCIGRILCQRLSREQLRHLTDLLDDALWWAGRLEELDLELNRDICAVTRESRADWAVLMLERFRRMQFLADAVWLRLPPIECIVDRLAEKPRRHSSRDRSPPPRSPPLLVDKTIRRSTSI
ncbi:hypothetical protein D1007_10097 [Hordeum vulgare]|nr:hypothetical protein D1007_10097 [Hordeum vulgare]